MCCVLVLGSSGSTAGLDTTLIGSTEDEEVAVHTPGVVPGVSDLPVGGSVKSSPSDNADSVTSEEVAGLASVDTGLVGGEISVDVEGNLEGTTGHELALVGLSAADTVGGGTEVLGGGGGSVSVAVSLASGGGVLGLTAGGVLTNDVVRALGEGVGLAFSGHETSADPVGPGRGRVTTVAARAA